MKPQELFVGNAGTAARFLLPFLCLGSGVYRLHGVPRMHERPQAALVQAVSELGYRVESENGNDKLPVRIYGGGSLRVAMETEPGENRRPESEVEQSSLTYHSLFGSSAPKRCQVSIGESSQFASALLLSSKVGDWQIEILGENADESPYVVMTSKLMATFPAQGGRFQIEPDASSGSYFLAAQEFVPQWEFPECSEKFGALAQTIVSSSVEVNHWPKSGWQFDEKFREFLVYCSSWRIIQENYEHAKHESELGKPYFKDLLLDLIAYSKDEFSRRSDLGDSIMLAIAITPLVGPWPFEKFSIKFTDLGRLRVQECERVVALRTELTKCGAKVVEEGDTLTVYPAKPGELHGAEIETYHDHRMAMCFAILGLKVPGIRIKNPACVKKTFPNFFQKLAAPPPQGLGAEIWEVKNGQRSRKLSDADLFAE